MDKLEDLRVLIDWSHYHFINLLQNWNIKIRVISKCDSKHGLRSSFPVFHCYSRESISWSTLGDSTTKPFKIDRLILTLSSPIKKTKLSSRFLRTKKRLSNYNYKLRYNQNVTILYKCVQELLTNFTMKKPLQFTLN